MDDIVKNTSKGFIWRLLERFGAQGVTFIVSIILARLLDPDTYGSIALVTIVITILQVFVDSGLGNALIQKKNADDLDFSTVFWFNIIFCFVLYFILFVFSPIIASFYGKQSLTSVIRVLGLTIIISGVKNIEQAYVTKHMQFKKFFLATLGGTVGAAIFGIILAYNGYGVWALVGQYLLNAFVDTVILWIVVKWKPKFIFSFDRLRKLFSFGWKLLVSKLIDTLYDDARSLIIGKVYSSEDLAFYNRGKQFPTLLVNNVNSSIDSVLFPTMSKEQDDIVRIKSITRRSIKVSTYLIFPMMFGLAACARPMILALLTDKWAEAVKYVSILSISMAFYPILTANLNAIKSLGKASVYLKLQIIRKIIGIAFLLSSMWFGVEAIAFSVLANSIVNIAVNSIPNKKIIGYGFLEQIKDIIPNLIISSIMFAFVFSLSLYLPLNNVAVLLITVFSGVLVYLVLSILTKNENLLYLLDMVKKMKTKKENKNDTL